MLIFVEAIAAYLICISAAIAIPQFVLPSEPVLSRTNDCYLPSFTSISGTQFLCPHRFGFPLFTSYHLVKSHRHRQCL